MENNDNHQYYELAKRLIQQERKSDAETVAILVEAGLEEEKAVKMVGFASGQVTGNSDAFDDGYYEEDDNSNAGAIKDIAIGGLFCVGGIVATLADIGYIFWGAILFGGIQLIRGLIKLGS